MNFEESPQPPSVEIINRPVTPEKNIEESSNYKGNWWLVQLDRLNNPAIRKQLVDLWEANEVYIHDHGITNYVDSVIKRNKDTGEILWKDEDLGLPEFETITETVPYTPLTRELIEEQLQSTVDRETSFTSVDFSLTKSESQNKLTVHMSQELKKQEKEHLHHPDKRISEIGMKDDDIIHAQTPNLEHVMSLVESHEKGHSLRTLHTSQYLEDMFSKAFELPKSNFYLVAHAPAELLERMTQLKNYFGMKGDEKFTPKHLEYARKHYISDVGLDNNMTEFFAAITEEKEFNFLKLINSVGI